VALAATPVSGQGDRDDEPGTLSSIRLPECMLPLPVGNKAAFYFRQDFWH